VKDESVSKALSFSECTSGVVQTFSHVFIAALIKQNAGDP
jgi:hypothetical protein